MQHVGAQNPLSGAWVVTPGDTGVTASPQAPDADFPDVYAWQINSNTGGRLRYQLSGPTASESWVYSVRQRVVGLSDAVDLGALLEVSNGDRRFILTFGSDAAGATLIDLVGSDFPDAVDFTLAPSQVGRTDYIHVELVYNANMGTASLFLDGVLSAEGFTGIDAGAVAPRVNFGDGSSGAAGTARYANAGFTLGMPECGDGSDNNGDGETDGADANCQSPSDPSEGPYCGVYQDYDQDGVCEFIVASHLEDNDPTLGGWLSPSTASGQSWQGVDEDLGAGNCDAPCPYWRVRDNGTSDLGSYRMDIAPISASFPWELRARVRIQPQTIGVADSIDYSKTMFARFPYQTGRREFGVLFGITAAGIVQLRPSGTSSTIDIGSYGDYHDVRVVYDPTTVSADIVVNGSVIAEDLPGRTLTTSTTATINWGSASSPDVGQSHWQEVTLELFPDTDNDGLTNSAEIALGTNPYLVDSDEDGLTDADEQAALTDPLNPDSDDDSLLDGWEVESGLNPNVADADIDIDNDNLTHLQEQAAGSNPQLADSDGDGLEDGFEVLTTLTNPTLLDSDGDGLDDGVEVNTHNTDPMLADTDLDALSDGDELSQGTNPRIADTDLDGVLDGVEVANGTNPLLFDTDGDGLGDGFELTFDLDPLVAGGAQNDDDGDGLTTLAEQAAQTNPLSSDTDGDGLSDGDEVNTHNSNPLQADTDNDGMSDAFEILTNLNPRLARDATQDADNDGLSNLEEQQNGLDANNPDSDGDGFLDGEEIYIFATGAADADPIAAPGQSRTELLFAATDQPLFDSLPDPTFVDLSGLVTEQSGGTISQRPTITAQDIWDEGVAQCDANSTNIPLNDEIVACRDLAVSPTRAECIAGGNVSFASRSIGCCANRVTGVIAPLDDINNGCTTDPITGTAINTVQSFTINEVNSLIGGPYVSPTSINIGSGFGPRPTSDTPLPARDYQIGVEVSQSVNLAGGLTITPGLSSAEPGDVDLYYATAAVVSASRTSLPAGQVFTLELNHRPRGYSGDDFRGTGSDCTIEGTGLRGSCMSTRWPSFLTSLSMDFEIGVNTAAEIWSIDPESGDQLQTILNIIDESFSRSYEIAALDWQIGESLDARLFNGVPDLPEVVRAEVSISNDDLDLLGTGMWDTPYELPAVGVDFPFGVCPWKNINQLLCVGDVGAFLTGGTNLATLILQIPELNTPVTPPGSSATDRGFYGGLDSQIPQTVAKPARHFLNAEGHLINTLPNKLRPLVNLQALDGSPEGFLDAFVNDRTTHDSDVFRAELDIDGLVCLGTAACLGAEAGITRVLTLALDAIDLDVVTWTGWDASYTFRPNVEAQLRFSQDTEVFDIDTSQWITVQAGQPYTVVVPAWTDSTTSLSVTLPDGGVDVAVDYSFANNEFTSEAYYNVKVASVANYMQAQFNGLVADLFEGAAGFPLRIGLLGSVSELPAINADALVSTQTLSGAQMSFPGQSLSIIDRGLDSDGDGLENDLENTTCTAAGDADTDDDGLPDGIEDANRNGMVDPGESDPCLADTDGDGLLDGFERGLVTPDADTDLAVFVANPTPIVRSSPVSTDSDGDGYSDFDEVNGGGDPLDPTSCPIDQCSSGVLKIIRMIQ
ncbi:unnamed protein product [Symbiodinium necroappetens]|uniref:Uncharacterized protein n=1 Tax=Symbiodinium necroappetens TaxID=1628268 RepID=A0A812ZQW1_9DINO|nr:unnamed protein product [Symbiodinium necroappetens]